MSDEARLSTLDACPRRYGPVIQSSKSVMGRKILAVFVGDWNGEDNYRYPFILESDSSIPDKPFATSKGWGSGYRTSSFSIEDLRHADSFDFFPDCDSHELALASQIFKEGVNKGLGDVAVTELLLKSLPDAEALIQPHLMSILRGNICK